MFDFVLIMSFLIIVAVATTVNAGWSRSGCPAVLKPLFERDDAGRGEKEGAESASQHRIRGLSEEDREGFVQVWEHSVHARFESDPKAAVVYADLLVSDLLQDCVPAGDFGSCGSGESAPAAVSRGPTGFKYQKAHEIAIRSRQGCTRPEELKRAIVLFTAIFEEAVGEQEDCGPRRAKRVVRS